MRHVIKTLIAASLLLAGAQSAGATSSDGLMVRDATGTTMDASTGTDTIVVAQAAVFYYLDAANTQVGPFTIGQLAAEVAAGRIKPETLVWTAGMAEWMRADARAEVAALLVGGDTATAQYWTSIGPGNPILGPFDFATIAEMIRKNEVFPWTHMWKNEEQLPTRADSRPEIEAAFGVPATAAIVNDTVTMPSVLGTLTAEQRRKVGMVLGATLGVMLHEIGHALIGELGVPATGPEEDSVDEFSALFLGTMYGEESVRKEPQEVQDFLFNLAQNSALMWRRIKEADEAAGVQGVWWDEHSDAGNRFRNILCLVYGASPDSFEPLANMVDLPANTRELCKRDYPRRAKAWETIMRPYTRVFPPEVPGPGIPGPDTPGGKIIVQFKPSRTATGQALLPVFQESGIFQGIGEQLQKYFVWPRDLKLIFADCGEQNAFYSNDDVHVVMCWEGIEFFAGSLLDGEHVPRH